MHEYKELSSSQKRAIFAACAAAVVAMDNALGNSVFAYIVESYPQVPHSTRYLFQSVGHMIGVFAAFIVGPLTMRVSPKKIIEIAILGMMGVGIVYTLFGGKCPYWVMLLCAAIDGMESSIISCLPAAVVAVNTNNVHQTVKYTGYVHACVMGGGLFFSLLGGCIGAVSWQLAYSLYFITVPILLIVRRFMPDDMGQIQVKNHVNKSEWKCIRKIPPSIYLMFLQYFLFYTCTFTFKAVSSEYVISFYELGTSVQVGITNSIMTCAGIITGIFFSRVSRVLRRWLVAVLTLLMALGFVSMSCVTSSLAGCMIGAAFIGIAKGGMMPAVVGEMSIRLPNKMKPLCVSLLVGFMNLGMASSIYIIDPLANALGGASISYRIDATILVAFLAVVTGVCIFVGGGLKRKPHYVRKHMDQHCGSGKSQDHFVPDSRRH